MKQILIFLTICLLLTGCTDSAPVESPKGQDAQNQFMFFPSSFQETEDFYLGSNMIGNYLHYYDKASGISGVLCADPSCGHDNSTCGAYTENGPTVSVWDGKLYWVAPEGNSQDKFLWKSDLSGMNREKLKKLSFEDFILKYQPQRYVVHRGMLYVLGDANIRFLEPKLAVGLPWWPHPWMILRSLQSSMRRPLTKASTVPCDLWATMPTYPRSLSLWTGSSGM